MRRTSRLLAHALSGFLVLALAGFAVALLVGPRPLIVSVFLGHAVGGPFRLAASNGRMVTDRTYRGKWLLVFFGYTHCPDVCPTTLNAIAAALRRLGPAAAQVQPLFITVDPRRDTLQVLANYVRVFDPRIVGLTGTADQIAAVAREYKVYFAADETPAERDYQVDHSAFIYVMNPKGEFVQVFGDSVSGGEIAARLERLIGKHA